MGVPLWLGSIILHAVAGAKISRLPVHPVNTGDGTLALVAATKNAALTAKTPLPANVVLAREDNATTLNISTTIHVLANVSPQIFHVWGDGTPELVNVNVNLNHASLLNSGTLISACVVISVTIHTSIESTITVVRLFKLTPLLQSEIDNDH